MGGLHILRSTSASRPYCALSVSRTVPIIGSLVVVLYLWDTGLSLLSRISWASIA